MLIEKGGVVIQNTIMVPGKTTVPADPAASEPPSARVTLRIEWKEHESPLRSRELLVDLLQRAVIEVLPRAYQELEVRLIEKETDRA